MHSRKVKTLCLFVFKLCWIVWNVWGTENVISLVYQSFVDPLGSTMSCSWGVTGQYRGKGLIFGVHKEDFIKEFVCWGHVGSTHTGNFMTFCLRRIICAVMECVFGVFQPLSQIILVNVYSWCASECMSRCLIDFVPGQDEFVKSLSRELHMEHWC